ncbi:MAG TPA: HYR domain-containing protein, partial [Pyrinomonadaceae bacterium]|nr:HYR domain-containing protein [Pyrinomonadaceae bacterium]
PDKTGPFAQGDDLITWTFTDSKGNRHTQTQAVHVHDTMSPVPDAASLPDVTGECSAAITAIPKATDNCSGPINGTTTDSLVYGEQGTFIVTWHFKDSNGNESTQTQKVIVKDTTAPELSVPADATFGTGPDATSCSTIVSDATIGSANATDNCGLQSLTRSGVPAGNVFPVGTTTITYTATDIHGKVTTGSQKVTVLDNTKPILNVPANIIVATAADATSCTAFVDNARLTPTATDNCGVDLNSFTRTGVPAGNNFPVGISLVTYTVKDIHGNLTSGTQTVTVTDATLPVITFTGKTITLWSPDHKYQTVKITDLIASATDNCDPNVNLSKVVISMVTSDEPENINSGDGNTFNDIVIAPDCKSVDLRAERDGSRNGRVYTIYFAVKDSAGNVRTIKATVGVPKSQGPGGAAIDDTPAYPLPPPYQVMGSCPP